MPVQIYNVGAILGFVTNSICSLTHHSFGSLSGFRWGEVPTRGRALDAGH